jgi:phospholipase/carboxylesterase
VTNRRSGISRRYLLTIGAIAMTMGCAVGTSGGPAEFGGGRLRARPDASTEATAVQPGEQPLGLGNRRDGLLILPRVLPARAALVLLLHGATGSGRGITSHLDATALADRLGAVIIAPDSRARTWDAIGGAFGPDVAFIDAALQRTFARVRIDRDRIAIGGFSDGASYALSLGLVNGDLFTHVIAFSPGFVVDGDAHGRPVIFVSHGTQDEILPIDRTSRRLVPSLQRAGYRVDYREFDGPHTVPEATVQAAFEWMRGASH